ncbi:hypothetical protein C0993_000531 [Termitomyces sp. T159_Od127]|nr:hypothetical protein C0993_000531 [Termitomyces sp. T159_Od127]
MNRNENSTDSWGPDTLDREFLESGIDALRRMSRGAGIATSSLPPWTITRYEVDREEKIGMGFFSDVYRGTWRGRTIAIKVLAPTTQRELFVHEVQEREFGGGVFEEVGEDYGGGGNVGAGTDRRAVFPIWEEEGQRLEIAMGKPPWPFADDDTVRHFVLPTIKSALVGHGASPDPSDTFGMTEGLSPTSATRAGYHEYEKIWYHRVVSVCQSPCSLHPVDSFRFVVLSGIVAFTPSLANHSLQELRLTTLRQPVMEVEIYDSPAPQDEGIKSMRDKRRYRLLLNRQFHTYLTLALWEPSLVRSGIS